MKNEEDVFLKVNYFLCIERMLSLRDWETICEGVNTRILLSEVIDEEVMLWNVLLSLL